MDKARAWAAAGALAVLGGAARAQETVYLTNGAQYKGQVTGADRSSIQFYLPDDKLSLNLLKDRIKFIEFPAAQGEAPPKAAPTPAAPAVGEGPAKAEPGRVVLGKGKFFGAVEWFDPGDAYDTFQLNLPVQSVVVNQFTNQAISKSGGFGGRLGMIYPIKVTYPVEVTRAGLGFSLGFIHGPAADITVDLGSLGIGTGTGQVTANSSFYRLMLEFVKDIPLSSKGATFRLGAGAGLAIGELTTNIDAPGLAASALSTISTQQPVQGTTIVSWTGLSWELSPAITFYKGGTEFWLGLRYEVLPKLQGNNGQVAFEWNATGFYLGFGF